MDIVKPNAPVLPHKDLTPGQAAIEDAEKTLSEFKVLCKAITEKAKEFHAAGKDLVQEVVFNCEEGRKKVHKGEWTQAQLELGLQNLTTKQSKPWEHLKKKAEELHQKVDGPYKLVLASKENCHRARGDSVSVGWFGFATKEQKEVRRIVDHKLKHKFVEAAESYAVLSSFPDGLLTQIPKMEKKALDHMEHESKK